jgi:hypothetical protein
MNFDTSGHSRRTTSGACLIHERAALGQYHRRCVNPNASELVQQIIHARDDGFTHPVELRRQRNMGNALAIAEMSR